MYGRAVSRVRGADGRGWVEMLAGAPVDWAGAGAAVGAEGAAGSTTLAVVRYKGLWALSQLCAAVTLSMFTLK